MLSRKLNNKKVKPCYEAIKNVKKEFRVNGTIEADSPSDDAAKFLAEAYNLTIDVSGNIYGEGGNGGIVGGNGGNGGDALFVNNYSNRSGNSAKVTVKINSNGRIWAGGGGGAGGKSGNSGPSLSCYSDSISAKTVYNGGSTNPGRGCNSCPNVSGVTLVSNGNCGNNSGNRSRCRGRQERGQTCTNSYYRNCKYRTNFNVAGGNGGSGKVAEVVVVVVVVVVATIATTITPALTMYSINQL